MNWKLPAIYFSVLAAGTVFHWAYQPSRWFGNYNRPSVTIDGSRFHAVEIAYHTFFRPSSEKKPANRSDFNFVSFEQNGVWAVIISRNGMANDTGRSYLIRKDDYSILPASEGRGSTLPPFPANHGESR